MRLAIGIPCYHSRHDLLTSMSSLAVQTQRQKIDVILAFDGDDTADETIEWVKKSYDGLFHQIYFIKNNMRGGVGRNRNNILRALYGNAIPDVDLLTFLDADDGFTSPFIVEDILEEFKAYPDTEMLVGEILEQGDGRNDYIRHDVQSNTWVHGRILRVDKLRQYELFFPEHTNEDVCFCGLTTHFLKKQRLFPNAFYLWYNNPRSQTRDLTNEYNLTGEVGFAWSKIDCVRIISEKDSFKEAQRYGICQLPALYYISFHIVRDEYQYKLFCQATHDFLHLMDYYGAIKDENLKIVLQDAFYFTQPRRLMLDAIPTMGFDEWVEFYYNYGENL